VIPDEVESIFFLTGDIISELRGLLYHQNIDLILKKESTFIFRKTKSLFEREVCEKGKLIYEST
jgi:hypothetical protein